MRAPICGWLLLVASLAGCHGTPPPLRHEAYVWQQAWTPALSASLAGPVAEGLSGWRVLIGEQLSGDATPRWRTVTPDWVALARGGRPLTAVLRLDGQLSVLDDASSAALRRDIVERWLAARQAAGQPLALELDHDCATRRLPGYARFLRALQADVHARGGTLSITALPAWLAKPEALRDLLAAVDSHVLQVHAVSRPDQGLWNADQTDAWLHDWARLAPHPFALALPSVGSAVRVSASGDVLAVRSAQPAAARDWPADSRELSLLPDPLALAAFLARLQAQRPERLREIVWFRWPLPGDANGFTPGSWALLRRDPAAFTAASQATPLSLQPEAAHAAEAAEAREASSPLRRWVLLNRSAVDQRLPAELTLPAGCEPAVPLNGAQLATVRYLRLSPHAADVRLLPPGQRLAVALARCPSP
jgi:hypothetical protein